MLDHEKLDVYQISIEFTALAVKIAESIPRGCSSLADQLKSASLSIPFNIAEGCGKTGKKDKKKFYSIAKDFAMECRAILDVCSVIKTDLKGLVKEGKSLLTRIVAMLTEMCL